MGSKKFRLDMTYFVSLFRNAGLVGGAAALAYVAQNMSSLDLGTIGTLLVPVIAVGLDTAIKWMRDNSKDG